MDKQIEVLLKSYKRGDNSALERLMLLSYPDLYRIAYGYMKERMLSEDIVSETFLAVIQKIQHLEINKNFGGYLRTITINKCLNMIRKRKKQITIDTEVVEETQIAKSTSDEDELVRQIMAMIEEPSREILLLSVYGFSVREISNKSGYTTSQVRTFIEKAKKTFFEKYRKFSDLEVSYE